MAHFVEFTIEGLAGRKNLLSCILNEDVNIFFGSNGSGKTSLLKVLHSAMSNDVSIVKNVSFTFAEVKIYSASYKRVYTRTIHKLKPVPQIETDESSSSDDGLPSLASVAAQFDTAFTNSPQWVTEPKFPAKGSGSLLHRYLPTHRLYDDTDAVNPQSILARSRNLNFSEEQLNLYFARSLDRLWTKYSSELLGRVGQAQEKGLANILQAVLASDPLEPVNSNLDAMRAYRLMQAFLRRQGSAKMLGTYKDFAVRYANNVQLQRVVGDIEKVEREIARANAPRIKLQDTVTSLFNKNKSVRFQDDAISVETDDNVSIGLQSLSDGEKQMLRILVETLLAKTNCIIIDEPELSLHIDWQKRLVESSRQLNSSAQLIYATHSPEIMADVDDSKIFRI